MKEHVVFPRRFAAPVRLIYDDGGLVAVLKAAGRSSEDCRSVSRCKPRAPRLAELSQRPSGAHHTAVAPGFAHLRDPLGCQG